MTKETLALVDESLTPEDRIFIRKLEKFKDDLTVLLDEGVIKDIIMESVEETDNVDFYSDRNKRQLNSKNPIMVLKVTDTKAMFKKYERQLSEHGLNNYEDLESFAKLQDADDNVAHDKVTSFFSTVISHELTRNITRKLYDVSTSRFNYELAQQNREDEIDFMLLFSSIFGVIVQLDKSTLGKKKTFVRMIL